jgi:hypothetical protein
MVTPVMLKQSIPTFLCLAVLFSADAEVVLQPRTSVPLLSERGIAFLQRDDAVDFQPIRRNWVPQLPAHCGAASAVVVHNALMPEQRLTQDELFTEKTAHVITQDVVYRMGFTLQELAEMIRTRTGLEVTARHANESDPVGKYDSFVAVLQKNDDSDRDHLILNFSRAFLSGEGTGNGHFSPVADYNPDRDMVLILEVNSEREPYWISSKDIYEAMHTTDPVSKQHRGWLFVRAPKQDLAETP